MYDKDFDQEIEEDLKRYLMEDCMFLSEDESEKKEEGVTGSTTDKEDFNQFKKDFSEFAKKKAVVIKAKGIKLMDKIKNQKFTDQAMIKLPSELDTLTKATVGIGATTILLGNPLIGLIGFITSKYCMNGVKRNRRIDLYSKYQGEIRVIDAKLEELSHCSELNEEQKQQKYQLLKLRETYKTNLLKLQTLIN